MDVKQCLGRIARVTGVSKDGKRKRCIQKILYCAESIEETIVTLIKKKMENIDIFGIDYQRKIVDYDKFKKYKISKKIHSVFETENTRDYKMYQIISLLLKKHTCEANVILCHNGHILSKYNRMGSYLKEEFPFYKTIGIFGGTGTVRYDGYYTGKGDKYYKIPKEYKIEYDCKKNTAFTVGWNNPIESEDGIYNDIEYRCFYMKDFDKFIFIKNVTATTLIK